MKDAGKTWKRGSRLRAVDRGRGLHQLDIYSKSSYTRLLKYMKSNNSEFAVFKCIHPNDKLRQLTGPNDERDGIHQCSVCGKIVRPAYWVESEPLPFDDKKFGEDMKSNTINGPRYGFISSCVSDRVTREKILVALDDVSNELSTAITAFPSMNSAHEGYAVLQEECQELWDHVCTKPKMRDLNEMRKEAIQVAAMAVRFVVDVCNEERGRR